MERFRYGDRVEVIDEAHYLCGRRGTVIQVRELDGCGRVKFDRDIPDDQCLILEGVRFPDQTFLFPGHCARVGR